MMCWEHFASVMNLDTREQVKSTLMKWIAGGHPDSDTYEHCLKDLDYDLERHK